MTTKSNNGQPKPGYRRLNRFFDEKYFENYPNASHWNRAKIITHKYNGRVYSPCQEVIDNKSGHIKVKNSCI